MGMGIVENQYYYVLLMKNEKSYNHSEPLKRRFSDFDMLFEVNYFFWNLLSRSKQCLLIIIIEKIFNFLNIVLHIRGL